MQEANKLIKKNHSYEICGYELISSQTGTCLSLVQVQFSAMKFDLDKAKLKID